MCCLRQGIVMASWRLLALKVKELAQMDVPHEMDETDLGDPWACARLVT